MLYVEVACVRKALLHTIALEGKEGETLLYSTVQNQEVESILHYIYIYVPWSRLSLYWG